MLKEIFEERINKKTYEPQYNICGKLVPISALYDAPLIFEEEYLKIMTEEYGSDVAKEIKEKILTTIKYKK